MALQAVSELAEFGTHALDLLSDQPGMVRQGATRRRRLHAAAATREQGHSERLFHAAHPLAGRGQRDVLARRAAGDAAGFGDVQKQLQVGQIEAQAPFPRMPIRRQSAFVQGEG